MSVQLYVNAFVDAFRQADGELRRRMIAMGPRESGRLEGLAAAVVSALCRETGTPAPTWIQRIHSPVPFFVIDTGSFALRVRLMLESPPAFRSRNVFVPGNFLSRA